jgi:hypothetical protein
MAVYVAVEAVQVECLVPARGAVSVPVEELSLRFASNVPL